MREDLLQAIFLQYIGVRWSVFWKKTLHEFRKSPEVWRTSRASIPSSDRKRREFFLGSVDDQPNLSSKKQNIYRRDYFLSQLLDSEDQDLFSEEGDEEADFETFTVQTAGGRQKQTARQNRAPPKKKASRAAYSVAPPTGPMNLFTTEESYQGNDSDKPKTVMEAKQNLLHLLSTDILIKTRLHGGITCFRSQIDDLYPSLPHLTTDTVFKFFGVSQSWLEFFSNFLKAPLKFIDDLSSEPRQRQNGTPGAHVLSEVFGEVILFCLDFQINQQTGNEPLWRMQDDFWFWSANHKTCVEAYTTIERFVKIFGLQLNDARTGAVRMARKNLQSETIVSVDVEDSLPKGQIRWGMLFLNPKSGRFEIDDDMVDKHIAELSRQLEDKTSKIFAWVQAWNSYAATFFTSNFGKPASCFGRQHVDNMLATHERIQRQIFSNSALVSEFKPKDEGGSAIEFLRHAIEQRFGVRDIPDGYFFLPTELGGLEVQNSFIGLLQVRNTVKDDPSKVLDGFEEAEKEAYRAAKARFENGEVDGYRTNDKFKPKDADRFFSFEEYTKYREDFSCGFEGEIVEVFSNLLAKPGQEPVETDDNGTVKTALNALGSRPNLRGILANWNYMEPYWKWVAQLYGPEIIDKFGGFGIVDPGLLPMGMVSLFRSGRVNWQE